MRTLWAILVAIVVGFVAQAQQQVNNFRVLTNLYVGNAITGLTLNGYNIDAIATNSAANKLDITNGTAVALTGSLTNATANGIALTVAGISAVAATTAGDLQDLASNGILGSSAPARIRVLRDNSGRVLGSGRWYSKQLTDTRTSDGVTIVLPIDVPSDASPGRWVLEGYEQ
ncbi:MAG: hypothetical protein ACO25M_05040 [Limnohabitans sp.]